jgi:hypothetical protein
VLALYPAIHRTCQGKTRREVLRIGGISAAGLSLPDLFRAREAAAAASADVNCIFFFLWGGPGQHETFDPKPDAPSEVRGPFKPIPTTVDGLRFSEHLPRLAGLARRFTTVRNLHHDNNIHPIAGGLALSGQLSTTGIRPPNHGAVVQRFGPQRRGGLPAAAHIGPYLLDCAGPAQSQDGGFLGSIYTPFAVRDPREPLERIASVQPPPEVTPGRFARRRGLLHQVDDVQRAVEGGSAGTRDASYEKAFALATSPDAKRALDLSRESAATRERYGSTLPGQGALLARRLVEAGVRYVQVNWSEYVAMGGWDTHGTGDNMGGTLPQMSDFLLPTLDRVASTLFEDLEERGLHRNTVVVVAGEFGRTPKINGVGGREHWPDVYSALLFGAGIPRGIVIGESDGEAAYPVGSHTTPADLAATLYRLLGLDAAGRLRSAGVVAEGAAGLPL